MSINPMGGGDDVLASAEQENINTAQFESPATTSTTQRPDENFGLLPNNGEDEILGQIQALMQLTVQNQVAINKIINTLERQGTTLSLLTAVENSTTSTPYNNKGKSPLLSKENDPFTD
jgi:hypothetical protein